LARRRRIVIIPSMRLSRARAAVGVAYAAAAYAAFVASLGWAVTFLADRQLPRGIDHGSHRSAGTAVVVDLTLLLLFAVQHTVMARPGFKRWLTRRVPAALERSTYVLAASLILGLLFFGWQPVRRSLWHAHGLAADAIWAVFALGWVVAFSSTYMIDHFEFFGLRKAYRYARGVPETTTVFSERWFYAWVRHPLMLGLVVAFWATPHMTVGHLLFASASTAYVAVGVQFEERDLRGELGAAYIDYADRVPAVIPTRRPGRRSDIRRPVPQRTAAR